jgi:hypothetical protein
VLDLIALSDYFIISQNVNDDESTRKKKTTNDIEPESEDFLNASDGDGKTPNKTSGKVSAMGDDESASDEV